mmetsp:Transcript_49226/g.158919  ORF Transcript_49226/g.158919 Transcript_49226/m.158919 type:complete len:148 (-) Transcript_49226:558-1001(-)
MIQDGGSQEPQQEAPRRNRASRRGVLPLQGSGRRGSAKRMPAKAALEMPKAASMLSMTPPLMEKLAQSMHSWVPKTKSEHGHSGIHNPIFEGRRQDSHDHQQMGPRVRAECRVRSRTHERRRRRQRHCQQQQEPARSQWTATNMAVP